MNNFRHIINTLTAATHRTLAWVQQIEHSTSVRRSFIITGATLCVLIAAQASLLIVNHARHQYPIVGLRLEHQRISDTQNQELSHRLPKIAAPYLDRQITIKAGSYQQHVSPRQLGARLDEQSLTQYITTQGHEGGLLEQIIAQDRALIGQDDLPLDFSVMDTGVASAYLAKISQTVSQKPSDAHFAYQNNSVTIVPDTSGTELSSDEAFTLLTHANLTDKTTVLTLPVATKSATIHTADLRAFKPAVERLATAPLTINAESAQVTLSPQQLVDMAQVKLSADPTHPTNTVPTLTFDETKINSTLDQVAAQVNIGGQPRYIRGRTVLSSGQQGVSLSGSESKVALVTELLRREHAKTASPSSQPTTLALPVQHIDPPTVDVRDANNPLNNYAGQYSGATQVSGQNVVYLTFDDGPGGATEQTLDILKRYGLHSTFFLVGRNIVSYPNTVKRIVAEGHAIGNHSYTHSDLSRMSAPKVLDELTHTQAVFQSTIGQVPTLFRPPYGAMSPIVINTTNQLGLHLMMWNVDPRDWSKPGSKVIADRVLSAVKPGSIILLHSIHQQTVDALPSIIEGLRARGYVIR